MVHDGKTEIPWPDATRLMWLELEEGGETSNEGKRVEGRSGRCTMSLNDNFEMLKGETLTEISGLEEGSELVTFSCASGRKFQLYHGYDCCEDVHLHDVAGNVEDILNSPITLAEEAEVEPPQPHPSEYPESETWVFYKLATTKGYVTMRWWGSSNGYYCEHAQFDEIRDQPS